ncbi:MAG TPA: hypothetical protein VLM42_06125 [Bryobacteraceae bacterium]|nr:hypothetical protein [Bryobacteraceae bacterium]
MTLDNIDPTLFVDLLFGTILCVALAFFGWKYWGTIKTAPALWMHKGSERWPWAPAIYDDGRVQVWPGRRFHGVRSSVSYSVFTKFTYRVAGQTYRGWYWKKIGGITKEDAEKLLDSLRQGPLYVRYLPSKPQVYVCDPFRDVRP